MSDRQENTVPKILLAISTLIFLYLYWRFPSLINSLNPQFLPSTMQSSYYNQPLAMSGGDPYIRALMRTITASESNVAQPYHVLYGGEYVSDLSKHPEQCIPIITGPNVGNCTTAAGRYQFLNTTWYEKARQYHPKPSGILWWGRSYSFEPEYQDRVVHAWLNDPDAWGIDISQKLQQGKIEDVLKLLSRTWTSLGYGIETNSMSPHLSKIYQKMLQEELKQIG
jgi:muramidase (phage lysozyme)